MERYSLNNNTSVRVSLCDMSSWFKHSPAYGIVLLQLLSFICLGVKYALEPVTLPLPLMPWNLPHLGYKMLSVGTHKDVCDPKEFVSQVGLVSFPVMFIVILCFEAKSEIRI